MTDTGALLERLAPGPRSGPRAARGRAWLHEHGLPDRHDEAWRYTPLDEVFSALTLAHRAPEARRDLDRSTIDRLAGDHGGLRVVSVNGTLAPALSDLAPTPAGVWLGGAPELRARRTTPSLLLDEPTDGFQALNWAAGDDVAAVLVDPGVRVDAPIHVVHLTVSRSGVPMAHPRTVVRVGAGSQVRLIETFMSLGGPSITNASTRLLVGDHASATYHRIEAEPLDAVHIGRAAIEQATGSQVRATCITTGAEIARTAIDVRLDGHGASVDLDGLYLPTGHQRHDNVVTVDHAASGCTSRQRFKGIVDDHARGSFSGHVVVRPGTVGTDASQSNPNLVLAPTAQADTRPWLEIFADEVRCTHGSSVGRLDEDAIFYLRSRGIPLAESRDAHLGVLGRDRRRHRSGLAARLGGRDHRRPRRRGCAVTRHWSPVSLARDCMATTVPRGEHVLLSEGGEVEIVQQLGGSITVRTELGSLLRIDGADADALGLQPSAPGTSDPDHEDDGPFDMARVWEALDEVYDPEIPVSIVELGLVYRCEELPGPMDTRRIEIDMSMTAPGCGMGDVLRGDAARAVLAVPGVHDVDVTLVWDPPWTIHRMSEAARLQLGLL